MQAVSCRRIDCGCSHLHWELYRHKKVMSQGQHGAPELMSRAATCAA
jgi:hypothetical protein